MHVCVLCAQVMCVYMHPFEASYHEYVKVTLVFILYNYYNNCLWNPGNINQTDISLTCMTGIF